MKAGLPPLCARKRCNTEARAYLRSPMRISPGCGAPRSSASAPCWSVSSRFENPPRPSSNTPCTRQSVPMLPGLLTQVPSARRNVRPGQRSSGPGSFAASSRSTQAARNSVAWSSRYLTPGLLSSAIPCIDAQAAVWRNERPPGPRASAIRNRAAPSTTSRRRWMALLSIARSSRSRSAGSRAKISANRSVRTDATSCISSQNQAAPSRVKNYFSAYGAHPRHGGQALHGLLNGLKSLPQFMVDCRGGRIERVHLGEVQPQEQALMGRQPPAHGLDHLGVGGPDLGPDQAGKPFGIRFAGGKRLKEGPSALTHDVREHRAELDVGGLQGLVDALDVTGLLAGQLLAGTGEVA